MPEPGGLGPDGDFGADDADLDLVHPITERIMDLALDTPLQSCLGSRVGAGLDRDRRLIVIPPSGGEGKRKESPEEVLWAPGGRDRNRSWRRARVYSRWRLSPRWSVKKAAAKPMLVAKSIIR